MADQESARGSNDPNKDRCKRNFLTTEEILAELLNSEEDSTCSSELSGELSSIEEVELCEDGSDEEIRNEPCYKDSVLNEDVSVSFFC